MNLKKLTMVMMIGYLFLCFLLLIGSLIERSASLAFLGMMALLFGAAMVAVGNDTSTY